jgi:hypothetical protein
MKHGNSNTHPPTTALKIHPQSNGFFFLFASLHFNSIQNQPASIWHTLNNYQIPNPVPVICGIKRAPRTKYGIKAVLLDIRCMGWARSVFSNTLNLHVSLRAKERVSHSYKGKLSLPILHICILSHIAISLSLSLFLSVFCAANVLKHFSVFSTLVTF